MLLTITLCLHCILLFLLFLLFLLLLLPSPPLYPFTKKNTQPPNSIILPKFPKIDFHIWKNFRNFA